MFKKLWKVSFLVDKTFTFKRLCQSSSLCFLKTLQCSCQDTKISVAYSRCKSLFEHFPYLRLNIIILEWLACIGVADNILLWFSSYLSDREQFVQIKNAHSEPVSVIHGIPQGSVLGLLSFIIYILALDHIFHFYGINFHFYTDNTQVYISSRPNASHPSYLDDQ